MEDRSGSESARKAFVETVHPQPVPGDLLNEPTDRLRRPRWPSPARHARPICFRNSGALVAPPLATRREAPTRTGLTLVISLVRVYLATVNRIRGRH